MEHPDEFLRPIQLGLPALVTHAQALIEEGSENSIDQFIKLMLAGRLTVDDEERRVIINPRQDAIFPTRQMVSFRGDFDSLVGFSTRLPIKHALSIYPVPSFADTLTKNIHIHLTVNNKQIAAHKIPNICIGRFGLRRQVRLFFPNLYREDLPPAIQPADVAAIYNQGIRPTIKRILPEHQAHWPASYETELARAHDKQGRLHYSSIDIPEIHLQLFASELRQALRNHPRLGAPWFQIEFRGEKGAYSFPFEDEDERQYAFNLLIEDLDLETIQSRNEMDNWVVDVGVEIHHPDHVMQWLDVAHPRLVAHLLPSLPPAQAQKLTELSHFHTDVSAHLFELAGFRVEPAERGRADKVLYLNVYTTDKSITYQLHDGIFRERSATDLYPGPLPKLCEDLLKVADTFHICAGANGTSQDGTARAEVRVRLPRVNETLLSFPTQLLDIAVISIPNDVWWAYKNYRTIAIYYVLNELQNYPPESRALLPSLTLGAVCIYMLNAIMSRPRDWRAERALRDACCLRAPEGYDITDNDLVDQEFNVDEIHPVPEEQGMYVVADILRDNRGQWLRLPRQRVLELPQLCILYKAASITDVQTRLGAGGITFGRRPANTARTSNRITHTTPIEFVNPNAITPSVFGLDDRGVRLHPRLRLAGRDVPEDSDEEDVPFERDLGRDGQGLLYADSVVDRIWAQFPFDIISISPNLKSRKDPAYTTLTVAEQAKVTIAMFKRPVVPLRSAWMRPRDEKFWTTTLFNRYFPPKGAKIENMQNFGSCRYFQDWMQVMTQAKPEAAHLIRSKVLKEFRKLLWLPHTSSDRMWVTKMPTVTHDRHKFTYFSLDENSGFTAAPHIAFNQSIEYQVEFQLGTFIAEEEEEDTPPPIDELRMPPPPDENPFLDRPAPSILANSLPPSRAPSVARGQSIIPDQVPTPHRRQPSILSYLSSARASERSVSHAPTPGPSHLRPPAPRMTPAERFPSVEFERSPSVEVVQYSGKGKGRASGGEIIEISDSDDHLPSPMGGFEPDEDEESSIDVADDEGLPDPVPGFEPDEEEASSDNGAGVPFA